jgi:hypothetical protein
MISCQSRKFQTDYILVVVVVVIPFIGLKQKLAFYVGSLSFRVNLNLSVVVVAVAMLFLPSASL